MLPFLLKWAYFGLTPTLLPFWSHEYFFVPLPTLENAQMGAPIPAGIIFREAAVLAWGPIKLPRWMVPGME